MKSSYLSLNPFIHWMKEKHPVEWPEKFGRSAELEVEIGFGLGDFLIQQAQTHPEKNFLGIELGWVYVRRTLRKINLAGVNNVRVMQADIQVALERAFLEKSLHSACSLFPCPWPKKRHAKFRLFSNSFLKLINSRIADDGMVLVVTDSRSYLEWILSQVSGTGFEVCSKLVSPRFSTKYERKWVASGQEKFYELRLTKHRHIEIPLKEDMNLKTYRVGNFNPDRFDPPKSRGQIMVAFKETIFDPKQQKGMVRSVVGEDSLVQDFWIEIVRKKKLWHIRPAKGCSILPTAGIQRALDLVYNTARG